jgi:periplasmic protein TonB
MRDVGRGTAGGAFLTLHRNLGRGILIATCGSELGQPQWFHSSSFLKDMSEPIQGASPNSRFLSGEVPAPPTLRARLSGAGAVSALVHAGVVLFLLFVATSVPGVSDSIFDTPADIIWLQSPGPGGGGGGGGNKTPDPPRKAELPGKEKITVPVDKPEQPKPELKEEPPKPETVMKIPALQTASSVQELPGVITSLPTIPTASQGMGTGGGAGTGTGVGVGPGQGSGLGPGSGGGTGGGVYRPGNDVTSPRLVREVKPNYTGDAMRAKIQGVVTMEAVVNTDGSVGRVQIIRSLDSTFGLDQEAIRTVKQWRFAPGTRRGIPVPVLVEIEMTFTLR